MNLYNKNSGGLFDFNRDGKTTIDEQWIAYNMFKDFERKKEESNNTYYSGTYTYEVNHHDSIDSTPAVRKPFNYKALFIILVALMLILIVWAIVWQRCYSVDALYEKALQAISDGDCKSAMHYLEKANDDEEAFLAVDYYNPEYSGNFYKDSAVLYAYMAALHEYETNGDLWYADSVLDFAVPDDYDGIFSKEIHLLAEKLDGQYELYRIEKERIEKRKEQEKSEKEAAAEPPKRYYSSSAVDSSKSADPYNVYDYSDPEEFYEDNYDDFWDYEEAEDYYNSYHDDP